MNQTPNSKQKPFMTLHVVNFPTALMWACKQKSADECRTQRQFIIDALEKATGTVGKHPNPPRQSNPKKKQKPVKKTKRGGKKR